MPNHPSGRASRGFAPAVLAAALVLGGCGVRLDTPPPPLPSADAAETARQDAARRALALVNLASAAADRLAVEDPARAVMDQIVLEATAHADALGGVWVPPAWAQPPGAGSAASDGDTGQAPSAGGGVAEPTGAAPTADPPTADPVTADPVTADPVTADDVAAAVADAASSTCADAVRVEPPGLATVLASVCIAQRRAARVLGRPVDDLGRSADPTAGIGAERVAGVARALDAAGFAFEVAAARAEEPERSALAGRARDLRDDAETMLATAGVLGEAGDPRSAAYSLAGEPQPGQVEADVLAAWAGLVGSAAPEARAGVLAEMDVAAVLATQRGVALGPLPGLA